MAITREQFLKELRQYRISLFRPAIYRSILGSLIVPVSDTVDLIETYEVTPYGRIKIIASNTPEGLPVTTFDGTAATQKAITGALAFAYTNEFLGKCNANQINWNSIAGTANMQIVEQYLDRVGFLGDSAQGLTGFCNVASGVASVTLGTKTGGGTAWTGASVTFEEIVADGVAMIDAVTNGSYGYFPADFLGIPTAAYDKANTIVHTYSGRTAIEEIKQRRPQVTRIEKISHLTGAGSGSANRLVAMCTSKEVLTYGIRPFRDEATHPLPLGGLVPSTFRTCGCIVENKQGLAYGDGC